MLAWSLGHYDPADDEGGRGHRWLYEQGILHRDISVNNILLTGCPSPNRAILIDLDHAMEYKSNRSTPDDERSVGTLAFMSSEVITGRRQSIRLRTGRPGCRLGSSQSPHRMSGEGPGARLSTWPLDPKATLAVHLMLSQTFEIEVFRLHRFLRQAYSWRRNISSALYDRFDKMILRAVRKSRTKNWNANSPAFKMAANTVK
ncbi:hypothetical protein BV25DRAFT_1903869 [Artomyces pyxidatus]|uniref:Uncharacterized protein n=1 Tax=Artomyces pyxidatus TaxID=48021 RepID=A0ACB8SEX2_9AGAM|nr:hypothetical protein BV25DRAFT_1903869 [Artomyces pyxidatus]